MIEFFTPSHEQTVFEKQKTRALIWFMLSMFVLFFVLLLQSLLPTPDFSASDYFLPLAQIFFISVLFVLKKHGLKLAGNVFSIGGVLIITVVINIFDQDTVITKYAEEYYLAILILVFTSLFGSRTILIIAAVVIFFSTLRSTSYLLENFPEDAYMLREAQVYFSVSLFTITFILYYATKFADRALITAQKDAKIKEEQNVALDRARDRAERSELLYKSIVNNLVGGFYKTDVSGNLTLLSPSMMKITGFEEKELIETSFASLFVHTAEKDEFFETVMANSKIELFRAEFRTRDKGTIFIETNATVVVDDSKQFVGLEGIFYDISDQRKMEIELDKHRSNLEQLVQEKTEEIEASNEELMAINDELANQNNEIIRQKNTIDKQNRELINIQSELRSANRSLEEQVNVRTSELEESNKTLAKAVNELDRFVYSASHDLSAPLKSILGLVNIARMEDQEGKLHVHLNYIEQSILKQEEVIEGLIQYSRNARQSVTTKSVALGDLVDQVIANLRFVPDFDDVSIKNNIQVGLQVNSDQLRLQMIISNLLSNGIKYRDLEKDDSFVKIDVEEYDATWCLIVEDNGQGIGSDHQKKIFDMFYRANEVSDGTGLGLFIVNEAIERLGGHISVKSEPKKGTTFKIEFPKQIPPYHISSD